MQALFNLLNFKCAIVFAFCVDAARNIYTFIKSFSLNMYEDVFIHGTIHLHPCKYLFCRIFAISYDFLGLLRAFKELQGPHGLQGLSRTFKDFKEH